MKLLQRICTAFKMSCRANKVRQKVESQARIEDQLRLMRFRLRRANRWRTVLFWAFIVSMCGTLTLFNAYVRQDVQLANARNSLLDRTAMREEYRDFMNDVRDNVRTMPLWATAMWMAQRSEEIKAGQLEYDLKKSERRLDQCLVRYDGLKGSIDNLNQQLAGKNARIDELESNNWSGQVKARSSDEDSAD